MKKNNTLTPNQQSIVDNLILEFNKINKDNEASISTNFINVAEILAKKNARELKRREIDLHHTKVLAIRNEVIKRDYEQLSKELALLNIICTIKYGLKVSDSSRIEFRKPITNELKYVISYNNYIGYDTLAEMTMYHEKITLKLVGDQEIESASDLKELCSTKNFKKHIEYIYDIFNQRS